MTRVKTIDALPRVPRPQGPPRRPRRPRRRLRVLVLPLAVVGVLAACSSGSDDDASPPLYQGADAAAGAGESVVVYRTATCGCCEDYLGYLRTHGFEVESKVVEETASVRARLGMPDDAASCHTSVIAGYTVEGHVPVGAIERLLEDRPDIDGIAAPGMPAHSPGMGGDGGGVEVFSVDDGELAPFVTG